MKTSRKMRLGLYIVLVVLLIGCGARNVPKDYSLDGAGGKGVVVVSLTYSGVHAFAAIQVHLRGLDNDHKKWIKLFDGILQPSEFFENPFWPWDSIPEDKPCGRLAIIELPEGEYEFYKWDGRTGFERLKSEEEFSHKFEVVAGKAIYIGNLHISCFERDHFRIKITDMYERDLPLLYQRCPNITADKVETNLIVAGAKHAKADSLGKDSTKESQQLAYVRESQGITAVSLRTEPKQISDSYIETALPKHGFYDATWNPQGSFNNHFVDNGDGTITDISTGLMWQKGGCTGMKSREGARAYVTSLNADSFAGHFDWRLPTVDELCSLLEAHKENGLHIDPVFHREQKRCWSADRGSYDNQQEKEWIVDFVEGKVTHAYISDLQYYTRFEKNYVRAVRSIK